MSPTSYLAVLGDIPDTLQNLQFLREQLASGVGVVPFVGAGFSAPFGYPTWSGFLLREAEKVNLRSKIEQELEVGRYEEAAEALLSARGYLAFHDAIRVTFGTLAELGRAPAAPVMLLPRLTGPVITTNFDRVLETVFAVANASFVKVVVGSKPDLAVSALNQNRRVLLKIHGDADESAERILTRKDYEMFYGSTRSPDASLPLPKLLHHMLLARPLLFLGCGLNTDRTIAVLADVAREFRSMVHYAVIEAPADENVRIERARFLSNHNIRPIWYPHGRHEMVAEVLADVLPPAAAPARARANEAAQAAVRLVRFATERQANTIDLQRAVHEVRTLPRSPDLLIPLAFDPRVELLQRRAERLYDDFEAQIRAHGGVPTPQTLNSLYFAITDAREVLSELPSMLATVGARLCDARIQLADDWVARILGRIIEIAMTHAIAALARHQFARDPQPLLVNYAGFLGSGASNAAHIDGRPVEDFVSYRITFRGGAEQTVFAPKNYFWISDEFYDKERGYIPPLSFMLDYAFPQILWWDRKRSKEWPIDWHVDDLYVKDLNGDYIDDVDDVDDSEAS
jgi:hypothetical protein